MIDSARFARWAKSLVQADVDRMIRIGSFEGALARLKSGGYIDSAYRVFREPGQDDEERAA